MKNVGGIFAQQKWWGLVCLLGGSLAACGNSGGEAARRAAAPSLAATVGHVDSSATLFATYSVVNLDPGAASGAPAINASNQVAFTTLRGGLSHAGFFNGNIVRDVGAFGNVESYVAGLNDAGQTAGGTIVANAAATALRWSEAGGTLPLGTLGGLVVRPGAINASGQVTGWVDNPAPPGYPRAFFWSATAGARDLGALGLRGAVGEAINDAGMVAGRSPAADGMEHGFVWSAGGGMVDLGTNGGIDSNARLINNAGQVAGSLRIVRPNEMVFHAYVWNQASGMVDIGTLGADYAYISAMNQAGQVAGSSRIDCGDCFHAIRWSAAGGMTDLGTLGGGYSDAFGINANGEVVGWAESNDVNARGLRAFAWSPAQGMIDLSRRLANAPPGLALTAALAISDSGAIVADSNAGLVLLMPNAGGTDAPVVGPMTPEGPVMAGTPVAFAVTFSDRNSLDRHSATWSWNDGCGPDSASKVPRPGTIRANHTFCAAGEYWVTFKVTDSSGRSTTVGRTILVNDALSTAPAVAGSGWMMSPRGAYKQDAMHTGRATFGFAAGGTKSMLRFNVANLAFESAAYEALSVAGGNARYQGSGTVNGDGNYRFTLEAASGGASQGRLHMKIWHVDARTQADVVDYDNGRPGAAAIAGDGSAVAGGGIVIRQ